MKIDKEKFPLRLKELMDDNNENTYTLAEKLHLTPPTISRYVTGQMSPKLTAIESLARQFNVNPSWLMGSSNEKHRTIPSFIKIPVLGRIACGVPLYAVENIIDYEFVEENEGIDFGLIARGDSMINARIFDGDIVFIRKQDDVDDGDIAAVLIEDEATLKRVYKFNGDLLLRSENPIRDDIRITAKDRKNVRILGKAISFKSTLK